MSNPVVAGSNPAGEAIYTVCYTVFRNIFCPLFGFEPPPSRRNKALAVFHHRYHIVWVPKYRFKVLAGDIRMRVREIVLQVCKEMGVKIVKGVLSRDHVHMFVEIPPHVAVSQFVQRAKGRFSRKVHQEFSELRKRYWGRRFWVRGYFCTTSGNITNEVILQYLENRSAKPTGANR
ncbi:MAG: IS200/IS605 family transposase [Alphaproteobacteria bacterium]|nr:IS200/IS605 family transposase [Alphaproteobacteria bacterium]